MAGFFIAMPVIVSRDRPSWANVGGQGQPGALKAMKLGERALRVSEQSLQTFISARVVNPEDYFAPNESPAPEPQKPKVARSNWMNR